MKKPPKDVDSYIAQAPAGIKSKLAQLRETIKAAAPKASEKISWRMPFYNYLGSLAAFAAFKNHIGFFVMPPMIDKFKDELKEYETSKGTIRFPNEIPLPIALIKKLVKARVKLNEELRK